MDEIYLRSVFFLTVYKWCLEGEVSQKISQPFVQWGIVALACFDLLGFFSIRWVRSKSYNLFIGTHVVGLIVVLIGVGGSNYYTCLNSHFFPGVPPPTSLYPVCCCGFGSLWSGPYYSCHQDPPCNCNSSDYPRVWSHSSGYSIPGYWLAPRSARSRARPLHSYGSLENDRGSSVHYR